MICQEISIWLVFRRQSYFLPFYASKMFVEIIFTLILQQSRRKANLEIIW